LITFLWRPKKVFTNLRQRPIILWPIVISFILLISQFGIYLFYMELSMQSSLFTMFRYDLISNILFIIGSTIYFFVLFRLLKNKQSFLLILSVILHATLAFMYLSFFIYLVKGLMIYLGVSSISGGTYYLDIIIYIIYLGFGLKWTLTDTTRQFLIAFLSYVALLIILMIILVIIVVLLLMSLINSWLDFFCHTLGWISMCS